MKKYKVFMLLLVMSIVLVLNGCSNEPAAIEPADSTTDAGTAAPDPTPEPDYTPEDEYIPEEEYIPESEEEEAEEEDATPIVPDGFASYTSSTYGFSVHHPDFWILSDGSVDQAAADLLVALHGDEALALLDAAGAGTAVTWFDPTTTTTGFMSNINIVVTPSGGLTQEMLDDDELKELFQEMYDELFNDILDSFTRTTEIAGTTIGGNYFILFEADSTMLGIDMSFMQALTVIGPNMYTFTSTAPRGGVDTGAFLDMLGTFDA